MRISQPHPLYVIEKDLPSRRPETAAAEMISSHSADPVSKSSAFTDFCISTGFDIVNAAMEDSVAKSSADKAAITILTAVHSPAFPVLVQPMQSSGEVCTAYPFAAPATSLSQLGRNLADAGINAGINLTVGRAVSLAVTTIGNALLPAHPQLVKAIDFVAGVIVVNAVKKKVYFVYDRLLPP